MDSPPLPAIDRTDATVRRLPIVGSGYAISCPPTFPIVMPLVRERPVAEAMSW